MALRRAKSVEEYVEWIKNARFEVQDLRECLLFEADDMPRFPVYLEPLEQGIEKLYQDMCDGVYHFGREDLPYMEWVHQYGDQIPFHLLLKQINETHRKGLEVDDDE
ncbi:MAG: hypothetical protein ABFR19_06305 [Pseudomonadota bacterium]